MSWSYGLRVHVIGNEKNLTSECILLTFNRVILNLQQCIMMIKNTVSNISIENFGNDSYIPLMDEEIAHTNPCFIHKMIFNPLSGSILETTIPNKSIIFTLLLLSILFFYIFYKLDNKRYV